MDKGQNLLVSAYSPEPCPNVFDFKTNEFDFTREFSSGDKCRFSHNRIEMGYHPNCYKTRKCIYHIIATKCNDELKSELSCPFRRDSTWFVDNFGDEIKRIKRNTVYLKNGIKCALDYCPFYHEEEERRDPTDPAIVSYDGYHRKRKKKSRHWYNKHPYEYSEEEED